MIDQQLNPGVINVLIDYVLMTNNKKLSKELVETIAGQWKRLNVETVKDAMEICRKEHKKIRNSISKTTTKKEIKPKEEVKVPDWFDKKMEVNKENIEEFDNLLEGF